jgi:signal transduction histidine kinase
MSRRFAPGLRARIVAALAVTGAVTLLVAALTLLPPLERQLREDERDSLISTASDLIPALRRLPASALKPGSPRAAVLVRTVAERTEGKVALLDASATLLAGDRLDRLAARSLNVQQALRTGRRVAAVSQPPTGPEVEIVLPVEVRGRRTVLVVRRRLNEAVEAAGVVKRGFFVAGLAGLGVAVVLGVLIATGLVRRLRALRDTALRVAEEGPGAEVETENARDEVGDLTRAIGTMQQRLREQESARRTFVATASHELRTPLASMLLTLEEVEEDLAGDDPDLVDAREQVARAGAQTRRLTGLAADLLDLSRIDAGVPLRTESLDLARLARAVTAEFATRAAKHGARIDIDGEPGCWATADPGSVARIARILVDNALRFTPPGAAVELSTSSGQHGAALSVGDRGPGVPAAERAEIFERFRRGSQTGGGPGFGLGLAIGRELARLMNGDLRLDQRDGGGAVFTLLLPAGSGGEPG